MTNFNVYERVMINGSPTVSSLEQFRTSKDEFLDKLRCLPPAKHSLRRLEIEMPFITVKDRI